MGFAWNGCELLRYAVIKGTEWILAMTVQWWQRQRGPWCYYIYYNWFMSTRPHYTLLGVGLARWEVVSRWYICLWVKWWLVDGAGGQYSSNVQLWCVCNERVRCQVRLSGWPGRAGWRAPVNHAGHHLAMTQWWQRGIPPRQALPRHRVLTLIRSTCSGCHREPSHIFDLPAYNTALHKNSYLVRVLYQYI